MHRGSPLGDPFQSYRLRANFSASSESILTQILQIKPIKKKKKNGNKIYESLQPAVCIRVFVCVSKRFQVRLFTKFHDRWKTIRWNVAFSRRRRIAGDRGVGGSTTRVNRARKMGTKGKRDRIKKNIHKAQRDEFLWTKDREIPSPRASHLGSVERARWVRKALPAFLSPSSTIGEHLVI